MKSPQVRSRQQLWSTLNGWPRVVSAIVLVAAGVLLMMKPASAANAGPHSAVVLARHALSAGSALTAEDLRVASWPVGLLPAGSTPALSELVGKSPATTIAAGEPVTVSRLLNTAISAQLAVGQVAVTVRLANSEQGSILQAGARVDLFATSQQPAEPSGSSPRTAGPVATDVVVLAVLGNSKTDNAALSDPLTGPSIVIACAPAIAASLAGLSTSPFGASLRPSH